MATETTIEVETSEIKEAAKFHFQFQKQKKFIIIVLQIYYQKVQKRIF